MATADRTAVIDLMMQSRFPISGISSRSLYSALCNDALRRPEVHLAVAVHAGEIVAFLLAIADWRRYWLSFLFRHPFVGTRIILRRLTRKRTTRDVWDEISDADREYIDGIISATPSGRHWSDSSPHVAKVVFVHVAPNFRKRGISTRLYAYMFQLLAEAGITRIDAQVDIVNRQSILLHVAVGYRLERFGNALFATRDI